MGVKDKLQQAKASWKVALSDPYFRWQFLITMVLFFAVSKHNFHFLNLWEAREGFRLHDPVLNMLQPRNFSNIIFFFTYSAILFVLVSSLSNPGRFVRGIQAYALIVMLRTASIYFFPLEAPAGMVLLVDPVANFFLHTHTIIKKDLFFSGHTATLAFMFLMAQNRFLKIFCFIALLTVPLLLMWQHVHYTVDIVFAPFVAYCCARAVDWVNRQHEYGKALFKY